MPWQWMFYTFGLLGFAWVLLWVVLYREVRGPTEEEFIQPPKVPSHSLIQFATYHCVIIMYRLVQCFLSYPRKKGDHVISETVDILRISKRNGLR